MKQALERRERIPLTFPLFTKTGAFGMVAPYLMRAWKTFVIFWASLDFWCDFVSVFLLPVHVDKVENLIAPMPVPSYCAKR